MNGNLNWTERLRELLEGYEPNVRGDWNALQTKLDAGSRASMESDLVRRVRSAQRIAIGATAVAASLVIWTVAPVVWHEEVVQPLAEVNGEAGVGLNEASAPVPSSTTVDEASHPITKNANEPLFSRKSNPLTGRLIGKSNWQDVANWKMDPSLMHSGQASFSSGAQTSGARTSTVFVVDLPSKLSGNAGKPMPHSKVLASHSTERGAPAGNQPSAASNKRQSRNAADALGGSGSTSNSPFSPEMEDEMAGFDVSVQEACAGTSVSFALNGLNNQGSVLWNFGDGGFSQDLSPTHVYENPGTYDITVSVRAPGDGTIRTRTVENMIVVRPKPEAKMRWSFLEANPNRSKVKLIDETQNSCSSTWLVEQEDVLSSEAILAIPGEYHVNLVASNSFGCQDVAVEKIRLGSRKEAIAPALFSPNGDGRYDTFIPLMLMDFEGTWTLTVWDGNERVFQSFNARDAWDGKLSNGQVAKIGKRYLWRLETVTPKGERHLYVDEVLIDG